MKLSPAATLRRSGFCLDSASWTSVFLPISDGHEIFVAVPAVWTFNYFTNKVEAFDVEMDNSSSELVDYFLKRRNAVRR